MPIDRHDVVIIGGAAMGSATAFYLSRYDPSLSIAVIEKDPSYSKCSTVMSDGNVRYQFNLRENIQISQFAMEVLETFEHDMAVGGKTFDPASRHQGNLFLTDATGVETAHTGLALQQSLGCDTQWLEAEVIEARWPAYSGPDHVGGTFGPSDGSVDPHAVLHGYRAKARHQGVAYMAGDVASLKRVGDKVTGVDLADGSTIEARTVVNCAGAWSPALLTPIGVDIPVIPVRRSVYVVETAIDTEAVPSVFLPTGLYLVPERGGTFVVGWSRPSDPVGIDFGFSRDRFEDELWPELVRWLPAFDALHVRGGWSGLYAVNTLDANAIIGAWPTVDGLYVCTGFSGHGFQQCHAVGRYLAELITGRDHTLDLSRLGPKRILTNTPVHENPGRLI